MNTTSSLTSKFTKAREYRDMTSQRLNEQEFERHSPEAIGFLMASIGFAFEDGFEAGEQAERERRREDER